MKRRLPHLDPLVAFEAAARHSSFALAARDLSVTGSAVSQQIRTLEAQLGVKLFARGHRSVQLTERGQDFYNSVSIALLHLENAANAVRSHRSDLQLEIATDTSIAALWLMPRLARFESRYPDVSLRLNISDNQADLLTESTQIAVVHGDGSWRGYASERLFEEEVFPVCAPEWLARWQGEFAAEDLAAAGLLDLEYEHWDWMNWSIWLTETGLSLPSAPRKLRTNNYPVIMAAAIRGAGVALGWRYLVDDYLEQGVLVRPVRESVKTENGYFIAWPYNDKLPPLAQAFKDWLLEERDRHRGADD